MNPHDKDDFAKAWAEVDATDDPVEIREAFERDDSPEHKPARHKYQLVHGRLEKIDGEGTQEA